MHHDPLGRGLASAMLYVQNVLDVSGDGPLPRAHDPFVYRGQQSGFLLVLRSRNDRADRLTWGEVFDVVIGLWNYLYLGQVYHQTGFDIVDSARGQIGLGALTQQPLVHGNFTR